MHSTSAPKTARSDTKPDSDNTSTASSDDKARRDLMRNWETHGLRLISDLPTMSSAETTKWLIWNLHENLDEIRKLEPTLSARVISSQLTVCDGHSMWTDHTGLERWIELRCDWQLMLKYPEYQNERAYSVGDGWIELFIGDAPPSRPPLADGQKGYLDADNALYPNQLFLYGWISAGVWDELKPQVQQPSADCQVDILLHDNFLFPVKNSVNFVTGPTGSVGMTNLEIRILSHARLNTWSKNKYNPVS
ncbi:MAG: hypothetical protein ABI351_11670 [Herbaspirillum sp.]